MSASVESVITIKSARFHRALNGGAERAALFAALAEDCAEEFAQAAYGVKRAARLSKLKSSMAEAFAEKLPAIYAGVAAGRPARGRVSYCELVLPAMPADGDAARKEPEE
jgi:3-deoxy-D-arabino-heptulosonate 7-phosphate (DAHP) synthase class II